jgi:hypothetical protein
MYRLRPNDVFPSFKIIIYFIFYLLFYFILFKIFIQI